MLDRISWTELLYMYLLTTRDFLIEVNQCVRLWLKIKYVKKSGYFNREQIRIKIKKVVTINLQISCISHERPNPMSHIELSAKFIL